jgi:DNA-binding response OmpR family regulator
MLAAATALKVLVVEDDADACEAIAGILQAHGYETECVATVGAALVRLESWPPPSALVLDLKLPDAHGGLLLRRIRRDALPVKVALVTGVADLSAYPHVTRFPPDRIFKKPLDMPELVAWLSTVL